MTARLFATADFICVESLSSTLTLYRAAAATAATDRVVPSTITGDFPHLKLHVSQKLMVSKEAHVLVSLELAMTLEKFGEQSWLRGHVRVLVRLNV